LALKFVATRPFVTATIIGATSMAQLRSDLAAFACDWTETMEKRVNALHRRQPNPCP
jgi:aryl-alcohol dehydrogenase-like predicted oxidoreductase